MPEKPNNFVSNTEVFDSFSKGWRLTTSAFWPLLAVVIILMLLDAPSSYDGGLGINIGIGLFVFAWGIFLSGPIKMSASWFCLKVARKEEYRIGDMFAVFKRNYWNAVGAGLLSALFIIVGFVLLIVPGIIVAIRLSFVNYLVIDQKMGGYEAIKASWAMTKGYSWRIFGFILLSMLIVLGGLIALVVGALFSMVWISSSFAILYNSICVKNKMYMKMKA